jgi:hypothetical protein
MRRARGPRPRQAGRAPCDTCRPRYLLLLSSVMATAAGTIGWGPPIRKASHMVHGRSTSRFMLALIALFRYIGTPRLDAAL